MSEKKINYESRGTLVTGIWLVVSVYISIIYIPDHPDWAGIGALLSGIFAPIALGWFYVSYQLQRQALDKQVEELKFTREEIALQRQSLEKQVEELGLSRDELSLQRQALDKQVEELKFTREEIALQRQALEHQVIAQQGSEQALKEQSQALTEQLAITQKQFEAHQKEIEDNKPRYRLASSLDQILISGAMNNKFYYGFHITNTRGKAEITDIEFVKLNESFDDVFMRYLIDNFNFEIKYEDSNSLISIYSECTMYEITKHLIDNKKITLVNDNISKVKKIILMGFLKELKFRIYYNSVRTGMNSDIYSFIVHNDKDIELVREVSNSYRFSLS